MKLWDTREDRLFLPDRPLGGRLITDAATNEDLYQ